MDKDIDFTFVPVTSEARYAFMKAISDADKNRHMWFPSQISML
jgi:hypothetical protein